MIKLNVSTLVKPPFWKNKEKAYYISFDGSNLGGKRYLYLRRNGTISDIMGGIGTNPRFLYFYSKKRAEVFCKIARVGYECGVHGDIWNITNWTEHTLLHNLKSSCKFHTKISFTGYRYNGTLGSSYNFSSSRQHEREAFVKTYKKFYEIGKSGLITLDTDSMYPIRNFI